MRKLTLSLAVLALAVAGCSKHNSTGTSYYFTYTHGAIPYRSRINDSLFFMQSGIYGGNWFGLSSARNQEMSDSAAAGLLALSTWSITCWYPSGQDSSWVGTYTTDTGNIKRGLSYVQFRFYYSNDPQQGHYDAMPGLPFSVIITAATPDYIEGTFEGKLVKGQNVDTTTVSNGKFRLPRK